MELKGKMICNYSHKCDVSEICSHSNAHIDDIDKYPDEWPELAAMTFNQLNISVRSDETKVLIDEVIKKISNE